MAEKNTFPVNSTVIYNRWEFGANSVVDIRRSKMAWPKGKSVGCGSGTGNAGGEEPAQVLLGRGGKDRNKHREPDQRQGVGTRAIFRNKAELATLEGVR